MRSHPTCLPIRPRPIPGELAVGYLVRVSSANGYNGPRELCRVLRHGLVTLDTALRLAQRERSALFGPTPHYCSFVQQLPGGLRAQDFNHHFMRWCPICLAESEYLRGEWGLKLCCVCTTHAAMLVDRCPHCQAMQCFDRTQLSVCSCGFQLTRCPCQQASEALLNLHQILQSALAGRYDEPDAMSLATWLRLVKYLGSFEANPLAQHPGQVKNMHQLVISVSLAIGTATLLADWPESFDRLLTRIRAAAPSATHIDDAFGPLYRVLYRDLNEPALTFLRERFEAYLYGNWFGLLGRRNRRLRPETITRHPHRSIQKIAQAAGSSAASIRHLAYTGAIRGHAIQYPSGRTAWVIPHEEARNAATYRTDSVTLRQAAGLLGLGRKRVRELIDAGLLHAWIDPGLTGASTWWLSKADALHLVGIGAQSAQENTVRNVVRLTTVLKTWRLRAGEFPALIRTLLAGELQLAALAAEGYGLGRLRFEVGTLRTWLETRRQREGTWISVDSAAKQLGLKQQVTYELVARGLLSAKVHDGTRRIHRDALVAFSASYTSLAEIARANRKTPRQMLARLTARPVCGPTIDGARQYFYKRNEIEPTLAARPGKKEDK